MKSIKLLTALSFALMSFSSLSIASAQESTTEPQLEVTAPVTENAGVTVSPAETVSPSDEAPQITITSSGEISIQATSASYSFSNLGKGSGEISSKNTISWTGDNATVTLTLHQYEDLGNNTYGAAYMNYDLESQNGNRCGLKIKDGNYFSDTATISWTNVKAGTYKLIISNSGTGWAAGSGTFAKN